jgi:hypothetical protein
MCHSPGCNAAAGATAAAAAVCLAVPAPTACANPPRTAAGEAWAVGVTNNSQSCTGGCECRISQSIFAVTAAGRQLGGPMQISKHATSLSSCTCTIPSSSGFIATDHWYMMYM